MTSQLQAALAAYLGDLATHGYAGTTVSSRRYHLAELVSFLHELGVDSPGAVSFPALESYQRHLYRHRKRDGAPLSFATQSQRLVSVKAFFAFLAGRGEIALDPAASIALPKTGHQLPETTLSAEEAEAVLGGPDTTTPLGVRDRAVLEVLYASAIRRAELIGLRLFDVDRGRQTLFVRRGKGGRDRHVPLGRRALSWVDCYERLVRPQLVREASEVLFLSASGGPLCGDWLSRTVTAYVAAGSPGTHGSCHLFRHSAATLMLDGGADIRYVAEMLGHQKLETTRRYTHVSIARLRAVHAATHPAGDDHTTGAEAV